MYDMSVIIRYGNPRFGYADHGILHFKGLVPKSVAFGIGITDTILTVSKKAILIVQTRRIVVLLLFNGGKGNIACKYLIFKLDIDGGPKSGTKE